MCAAATFEDRLRAVAQRSARVYRNCKANRSEQNTEQVLKELEKDHPRADNLLSSAQDNLTGCAIPDRQKIITVPAHAGESVETRRFHARRRSLDGHARPYEAKATEAYYNISFPILHGRKRSRKNISKATTILYSATCPCTKFGRGITRSFSGSRTIPNFRKCENLPAQDRMLRLGALLGRDGAGRRALQ